MRSLPTSILNASSILLHVAMLAACGDDSETTPGSGGGTTSSGGSATASGPTSSAAGTGSGTTTGSSTTGSSASSSGGEGGGMGQGGMGQGGAGGQLPAFGDACASSDDCFGAQCVEINGYRTCRGEVLEATECTGSELDQCCDTNECADPDQICTLMPDAICGGPEPQLRNECVSTDDQCLQLDCGKNGDVCAPPGTFTFSVARCLPRACNGNEECTDGPGGSCIPVADPCCNGVVGFFCAYAGEGCSSNSSCIGESYCQPDLQTGVATCVEGFPQCPQ